MRLVMIVFGLCLTATSVAEAVPGTVIDARQPPYGAVGNGTSDDWWAIQSAMIIAGRNGGGTVRIAASASPYRISQALRAISDVTVVLEPGAKVLCTGDAGRSYGGRRDPTGAQSRALGHWPIYGCLLLGGYDGPDIAVLMRAVPPYSILPVRPGDPAVRLADARQVADFAPGDVIAIDSATGYTIGKDKDAYPVPTYRQMDVVQAVGAGALRLRHPIEGAPAGAHVLRLTNGAHRPGWPNMVDPIEGDTGIPLWATHDVRILGGDWNGGGGHPFSAGAGAVDAEVAVRTVTASLTGVGYGNMLAYSRFAADREETGAVAAVELSEGSHGNMVEIGKVQTSATSRVIGLNESARNNTVTVQQVRVAGGRPTDVVQVWNASGNHVCVGSVEGGRITGSVVRVAPWPWENAPAADDNLVTIGSTALESQSRYVTVDADRTHGTRVVLGQASGAVTDGPVLAPQAAMTVSPAGRPGRTCS